MLPKINALNIGALRYVYLKQCNEYWWVERRGTHSQKGEVDIDGQREEMKIGGWREDVDNFMLTKINAAEIGELR